MRKLLVLFSVLTFGTLFANVIVIFKHNTSYYQEFKSNPPFASWLKIIKNPNDMSNKEIVISFTYDNQEYVLMFLINNANHIMINQINLFYGLATDREGITATHRIGYFVYNYQPITNGTTGGVIKQEITRIIGLAIDY